MLLKIAAIAALVIIGFAVGGHAPEAPPLVARKTVLIWCSQKHRSGDGPDRFCVRRMADSDFCRR